MSTKQDLIESIATKLTYLSKDDISIGTELVMNYLKEQLVLGNRIEIRNFGSFSIRKKKRIQSDNYYNTIYYRTAKNISVVINKI